MFALKADCSWYVLHCLFEHFLTG